MFCKNDLKSETKDTYKKCSNPSKKAQQIQLKRKHYTRQSKQIDTGTPVVSKHPLNRASYWMAFG